MLWVIFYQLYNRLCNIVTLSWHIFEAELCYFVEPHNSQEQEQNERHLQQRRSQQLFQQQQNHPVQQQQHKCTSARVHWDAESSSEVQYQESHRGEESLGAIQIAEKVTTNMDLLCL